MVYSDVIKSNLHLILLKKDKYTMHDVNKIYTEMFLQGEPITEKQAKFIVRCTAIYHNANFTKACKNIDDVKSMFV